MFNALQNSKMEKNMTGSASKLVSDLSDSDCAVPISKLFDLHTVHGINGVYRSSCPSSIFCFGEKTDFVLRI